MAPQLLPFLLALLSVPLHAHARGLAHGDTLRGGVQGRYPGAGRATVHRRHTLGGEASSWGFPSAGLAMAHRRYARARSDASRSQQGRSGGAFHRNPGRFLRSPSEAGADGARLNPPGPEREQIETPHGNPGLSSPRILQGMSVANVVSPVPRRRAGTRYSGGDGGVSARVRSIQGREVLALRRGERHRALSPAADTVESPASAPTSAPGPETGGQGGGIGAKRKGPKVRWHQVAVETLAGASPLSWVVTVGEGVEKAKVYADTCFQLAALTRCGARMDLGEYQRAWFVAYLTSLSANVTMIADVIYDPAQSTHQVCYTAPTVGNYSLEVKVVFTNAYNLTHVMEPANKLGFANYTTVLRSQVGVSGPKDFDLYNHRNGLPVCAPSNLSESRNRGYWVEDTWYPIACRVRRLEQAEMLQCLDGKRVLMIGDSETRIVYGILQSFLSYKSRAEFLSAFKSKPHFYGDLILHVLKDNGVPQITTPEGPPLNATTGKARRVEYEFLKGVKATFFGSIYEGFSVQQMRANLSDYTGSFKPGATVTFNLTLSSLFTIGQELFSPWKLDGNLTGDVNVSDGGMPADTVFVANQLHDVRNYNSSAEYTMRLISHFMPLIFPLLKSPDSFYMQGGLSSIEARKIGDLAGSANPRIVDFEDASLEALVEDGYPSFLRIQPITAPRPDLAYDSTHYTWPVSLAIIDLWLGTFCPEAAKAT